MATAATVDPASPVSDRSEFGAAPGPPSPSGPATALPRPPTFGASAWAAAPTPEVDGELLGVVQAALAQTGQMPTASAVAAAVRAQGLVLDDRTLLAVLAAVRAQTVGAGPLDALLREPGVTDVLVNAPGEVWVDRGSGLVRAEVAFTDDAAVRRLAQRLAIAAGRRLDDSAPYTDVVLPGGVRLHAVLAPIATRGTCLSLRVPRRTPFALDDLVHAGMFGGTTADLLRAVVAARVNFLVSGGTGTGKTTLLGALLGTAHPAERMVVVEDCAELTVRHPHVVSLETRPANVEGSGAVTLRDLVRQALRMRPDRLVVGEVRGAEVTDLLTALNTGHDGGAGTVHANSSADVPARLEALAALAALPRRALHSQLAAAVDLVVHLVRGRDGRRRLSEVNLLARDDQGLVRPVPAVSCTADGTLVAGPGHARLGALLTGWWRP